VTFLSVIHVILQLRLSNKEFALPEIGFALIIAGGILTYPFWCRGKRERPINRVEAIAVNIGLTLLILGLLCFGD
jgi:hypothetical protein